MPEPQIRYETDELRLLFEVVQALEGASDISDHLAATLEMMARYTGMMRGMLTLIEPNGQDIMVEAAYGLNTEEIKRGRYKLGEGITGKVIATGKPMAIPKVSEEPLFLNRTGARDLQKEEISFICVPIALNGKILGALSADRLFADSVCMDEDMRLLQVLASLIAKAVQTRQDFIAMHSAVMEENRRLQYLVHNKFSQDKMVGSSAAIRSVMEELRQVSSSNATVLLRGESGTGKELVAGLIHANSPRAGRPFIKINCAALPEGLVESELFGSERGAFTGSVASRKGRFEMAHGGTLFLDEVADMTTLTQSKLLRAIQEKEFERVGGSETIRVDVRLIAATNRNLEEMVSAGLFRQDLYYRLSVFPIILPPLRRRRDDIMPLAVHFIDKISEVNHKKILRIAPDAITMLMQYDWPGNIRELENVIERAIILSGAEGVIDCRHLPAWLQPGGTDAANHPHASAPAEEWKKRVADASTANGNGANGRRADGYGTEEEYGREAAGPFTSTEDATLEEALNALEKRMIMESLEESGGNMAKAARKLGITERIMGLRMKKYSLDYRYFRKGEGALPEPL
ncbi:MAG: sigma 54-interacting transcriptional regulator [Deltaproteobacteria bacterium]|jgi:Nif-specific regulatory protein|nr:sigma 54-interacting transcriptional regulator [Deltaproteobacteria bacterium]